MVTCLIFFTIIIAFILICYIWARISNKAYNETLTEEKQNLISGKDKWLVEHKFVESSHFEYHKKLYVGVDSTNKQLLFYEFAKSIGTVIDFSMISGMNVLECEAGTDGVERAILGDILFGGVGAIVGATTASNLIEDIKVVILCNDINKPKYEFLLNNSKIETTSYEFKQIKEFINTLDATINAIIQNRDERVIQQNTSLKSVHNISDELTEYKKLLDAGLITQEDYDKKKKILLDI